MRKNDVEVVTGDGIITLKGGYTTTEKVLIGITIILFLTYMIYLIINLPTILRILF